MNTYRIILLDTGNLDALKTETVFIQATKYQDAWQASRAILAGDEKAKDRKLFVDAGCTKAWKRPTNVNDLSVVKVFDCTPRNKKLDKATLADILADASLNDAERIKKIAELSK